jgi:hypothetical protein
MTPQPSYTLCGYRTHTQPVVGRSTGNHSDDRTREGALIGAAAGAIIGNERDKRK